MSSISFLRASFYVKNLPAWERSLRVVLALAGAALAAVFLPVPVRWVGIAAALGFGLTGAVGFCPLCALAGRRLANKS
jgi:hypothetical protein